MNRETIISKLLDKHFPNPSIPLKHRDPYTLLVAVLLSAQCTDVRVNIVTPTLFAKANTPHKMVQLSVEEIQTIIQVRESRNVCSWGSFENPPAREIITSNWTGATRFDGET